MRNTIARVLLSVALGLNCATLPSAQSSAAAATLPCRQVVPQSSTPVTWWSPPADRDRAKLLRWCETVGPVFFQPAPGRPAAQPIDRLAIVSWNLHVGGGDVDGLIRRLRAGEFTGGESVDHFVLLLQEAYRRDEAIPVGVRGFPVPGRIAASRDRAPDIGHLSRDDQLALLYAPSMRNGIIDRDREDRGNAIVSTIRLQDPELIELPLEHQRRVAVSSTVEGTTRRGSSWRVRLVDVHLDTALALTHGGPFAARRRQAEALIAALTLRPEPALSASRVEVSAAFDESPDATTIVAGDFNTWGGRERALDTLKQAFPDAPDSGGESTWTGPLGVRATLDHVFARGHFRAMDVRRLPHRFGSDHYPLLAIVSF